MVALSDITLQVNQIILVAKGDLTLEKTGDHATVADRMSHEVDILRQKYQSGRLDHIRLETAQLHLKSPLCQIKQSTSVFIYARNIIPVRQIIALEQGIVVCCIIYTSEMLVYIIDRHKHIALIFKCKIRAFCIIAITQIRQYMF